MTLIVAAKSADEKVVIVADTAAYGCKSSNGPAHRGLWRPEHKVQPIADGRVAIGLSGYFRNLSRTDGSFDRRVRNARDILQSMAAQELIDLLTTTLEEAKVRTRDDRFPLQGTQICVLSHRDGFEELEYREKD